MKILIFDDNRQDREHLTNCLNSFFENKDISYQITTCQNKDELLHDINHYDFLFLDIELGQENGIDLGLQLQTIQHHCHIIITTNYSKYAIDGYKIQAERYFIKPIHQQEFDLEMNGVIKHYIKDKNYFFLIKKYKYIIDEDYIDLKDSLLLSFQPLSIIIFIYVSNGEIIINSKNSTLIIFSLVLLIISNLISFYIFGETIKKNKIKKELDFEKMRIKENEQYYTSLKKSIYDFKAYRHDLKHHFSTLKSMLYLKKYSEAYKFVDSLYNKTCELSDIRSGDEFIDLVLTSRLHKIYFFNIKMYFEIRPLDLSFINAMDLNTIYANIIDNAINSCEDCKDRYIKIQTKTNNQYQIIKITNSCAYATEINGSFISTKKDNDNHGFGLTNIQKAAKKYNGFAQFKFDTNSQEFITTIIFKNNTKNNNT